MADGANIVNDDKLKIEWVPISSVTPDQNNARRHGKKNLDTVKSSLHRFGQQKPIVVDSQNVVRCGNGTLAAALMLGWKNIAIVRSDLAGSEMAAFAIVDNRSAELAEWDHDVLVSGLGSIAEDGIDLTELGFDANDLKKLLGDDLPKSDSEPKFLVVIECRSEDAQIAMLNRLQGDGISCRAMKG
jgi:ParB-like chromosome segregation protein Spo0J